MTEQDLEIQALRQMNACLRRIADNYKHLLDVRTTHLLWVLGHQDQACQVCSKRDSECKPRSPSCSPSLYVWEDV